MKTMIALGLIALIAASTAHYAEDSHRDDTALVKALSKSKVSLADGIRQVSKGPEAALSAKYEFDDSGKLSLSVYTAEKGLGADAEHNVLKEYSGSPEQTPWASKAEVFQDVPHVARSAEQHTLLALSGKSLLDFVAMAEKEGHGKLLSLTPVLDGRKGTVRVQAVVGDRIVESKYSIEGDEADEAGEPHH